MGKVILKCSKIEDAAKDAKTLSEYYDNCAVDLTNKVYNKLSIDSGSDSKGYISSTRSSVSSQIKILNEKKKKYSQFSKDLCSLQSSVITHESNAKKSVTKIATDKLGLKNRKWYEQASDWIYGTICVDLINVTPFTRGIGNFIKSGASKIRNKFDKAIDWFKHGDGKYCLNIGLSVLGDIVALAGTYSAIALAAAATTVTGGLATPLLVAAVASGIGTTMTLVDSGTSIYNNYKAIKNSDDPGRARYYGNIDGVNSAVKKYDMGSKAANDTWELFGNAYDATHTIADVTAIAAGSAGSAGLKYNTNSIGNASAPKYVYDKNVVTSNLKNTTLEKLGFQKVKGKYTFNAKNLLSMKKPSNTSALGKQSLLEKGILREAFGFPNTGDRKKIATIEKIGKIASKPVKAVSVVKNGETIIDSNTSIPDKLKGIYKTSNGVFGLIGKSPQIMSPIKDVESTFGALITSYLTIQ